MTIEPINSPSTDLAAKIDYARALAQAGLLPDAFRGKPAEVLYAVEVGHAIGVEPIIAIQEIAVISGKPSFSAKFMRALVRRPGHRLRESFDQNTMTARCVIIRTDDPEFEHVATWDMEKAKSHGYVGKGHWQKNPELMLKNRALSECCREACPEVLGGIGYTSEEVADFAPPTATTVTVTQATPAAKPQTSPVSLADVIKQEQAPDSSPMVVEAEIIDATDWVAAAAELMDEEQVRDVWRQAKAAKAPKKVLDQIAAHGRAMRQPAQEQIAVVDGEIIDETTGEITTT